jgi:hypothetical protein
VHLTERQLANEKAQTEGLLRETIPRLEIAEAKVPAPRRRFERHDLSDE